MIEFATEAVCNLTNKDGRNVLHIAAQNAHECAVAILLKNRFQKDVQDKHGKTALDLTVVKNRNKRIFLQRPGCTGTEDISFADVTYFLQRQRTAVFTMLLSKEKRSRNKCNEREVSLLHEAIKNNQTTIIRVILSEYDGIAACKDILGRNALVVYLQYRAGNIEDVLKYSRAGVGIECNMPFNLSEFHLLAYRIMYKVSRFFFGTACYKDPVWAKKSRKGPILQAIEAHSKDYGLINECRDSEGYTALHRAAQGGNMVAIKALLSWGADPTLTTPEGHNVLVLAIMYARDHVNFESVDRRLASNVSMLLLRELVKAKSFVLRCDVNSTNLTVYHLASYRGLFDFVKALLVEVRPPGLTINCSNKYGITPLYLANVFEETFFEKEKRYYWKDIVTLIKAQGGELQHINRETDYDFLYTHLYGTSLQPLKLQSAAIFRDFDKRWQYTHCDQHNSSRKKRAERYYKTKKLYLKKLYEGLSYEKAEMSIEVIKMLRNLHRTQVEDLTDALNEKTESLQAERLGRNYVRICLL